ncbi:inter-alpha-trypsin inhibitor isoform X2 [Microcaecilia unicolor]|uniref:Inter-alpha-trypsin inhibitor-like isoform X2 n=1 Tax=Microcaecilia unicolor TaxID=1415580 RepID=A0A6P7YIB8_9AMPH|nr:inter-alpha-trypsin inhibitor-like isoform X2 [Microcaecilia unicolor]
MKLMLVLSVGLLLTLLQAHALEESLPEGHRDFCLLEPDPGLCQALMPKYFYNSTSQACERFNYGGCGGNKNNFVSKDQCVESCINKNYCGQDKVVGPCKAKNNRYFYNSTSKACELFVYGGCFGNGNNFFLEEECKQICRTKGSADFWL